MIVGELEKNYLQINEMSTWLSQESHENGPLKEKVRALENDSEEANMKLFDEMRNVIDDWWALITEYENKLKSNKTMIAEYNHLDIEEHIIEFFQNLFIVKKKLIDKRIIHYFEWGNKNIHFYDVVNRK